MRIYIAGPMKGLPFFNFTSFDAAAANLRAQGHTVISPADMDREAGFDPSRSDCPPLTDKFLEECMRRDFDAIMTVEAVVLLPGWRKSTGATAEYHLARWRHIQALEYPGMAPVQEEPIVVPPNTADEPEEAKTFDDGKEPLAWLPWAAIDELSLVQAYGQKKYRDFNNYRKGMKVSRNCSCAIRHIRDFMNGRNADHESGRSPLAHAMCRLAFVLQNIAEGTAIDDRFTPKARPENPPIAVAPWIEDFTARNPEAKRQFEELRKGSK